MSGGVDQSRQDASAPGRRTLADMYALADGIGRKPVLAIGESEIDGMFVRSARRGRPLRAPVCVDQQADVPAVEELERQATAALEQTCAVPKRELEAERDRDYDEFCRREAELEGQGIDEPSL